MDWHSSLLGLPILLFLLFTTRFCAGLEYPQFVSSPSDETGYLSITLPCTGTAGTGQPSPTLSWLKDGAPLDVAADSRLTQTPQGLQVTGLQDSGGEALEGLYVCVASNALGTVRSLPANLTRTVWTVESSSRVQFLEVLSNSPLMVACLEDQQTSHPASYSWNILTSSDGSVGVALDGRLVFSSFSRTTSLSASCTVSNPVSGQNTISSRYSLSDTSSPGDPILYQTEIVIPPVSEQTVVAGETLILECFTTGNPVATIIWTKNGAELIFGGRISALQGARQLRITALELQDDATYTCTTASSFGPSMSASGIVHVLDPPTITTSFPQTSVSASQTLSLTCVASGSAPLTWAWLQDGMALPPSGRVMYEGAGVSSTLTVTGTVEGDSGVYQCVVTQATSGRQAAHHQLVQVTVVPPVFSVPPSSPYPDVLALQGTSVTIPCMASGFPPPTFSWVRVLGNDNKQQVLLGERHSIPAAGTGNGSLTISPAEIADTSTYSCVAQNSESLPAVESEIVFLRVIATPTIVTTPPATLVPSPGDQVTLPCSATTQVGTTVQYRWTRDGAVVGSEVRSEGTLVIPAVNADQSDNGLYACVLVVMMANAAPLLVPAASTLLTVGEPPRPPDPPVILTPSSIQADSFLARWNAPSDNGGLAIQSYSMELLNRGSPFCPTQGDWMEVGAGLASSQQQELIRDGVYPNMEYQYRVVVFTSVFSTTSGPSASFTTRAVAPRDPPTQVQYSSVTNTRVTLTWAPPTSCLSYGGSLVAYVVQYQVGSDIRLINTNSLDTRHTIESLTPGTLYQFQVAATNAVGVGMFSAMLNITTLADGVTPPTVPAPMLSATALNGTTVTLRWTPPTPPANQELLGYTVCYRRDGELIKQTLGPSQTSLVIHNLPSGSHTFNITAQYSGGNSSTVSQTVELEGEGLAVIEQPWFYAVLAGAGGLLVLLICILLCCICYQLRHKRKHEGSMDVRTSNHSQHKSSKKRSGKKSGSLPHVVVHSSPTPSRRSTDYAVPNTLRTPHPIPPSTGPPSSGPPSTANFSSAMSSPQFSARNALYQHSNTAGPRNGNQTGHHNAGMLNQQNGNAHNFQNGSLPLDQLHFHPYRDMTPSIQDFSMDENLTPEPQRHLTQAEHLRQLSASTSQKFIDTLSRVHTPPPKAHPQVIPPPQDFGSNYLAKTMSQEPEELPWNPGEMLNARGHMTNNPATVGRSDSIMSTESSNSMEFRGPSQLDHHRPVLAPLQEGDVTRGHSANMRGGDNMNYLTHVDEIMKRGQSANRHGGNRYDGGFDDVDVPLSGLELRGSPLAIEEYPHGYQDKRRGYQDERRGYQDDRRGYQDEPRGHRALGYQDNHRGYQDEPRSYQDKPRGEGFVASYEPEVHMSHSHSVYPSGSPTPSDPALSDPGYAVPPSRHMREIAMLSQQSQQDDNVYKHPPPAYAAPPPPHEDEGVLSPVSPPQASQVPPFKFPPPQSPTPTQQAPPTHSQAPPPPPHLSHAHSQSEKRLHIHPLEATPTPLQATPPQHQQSAPSLNISRQTSASSMSSGKRRDMRHLRAGSVDQRNRPTDSSHQRSGSVGQPQPSHSHSGSMEQHNGGSHVHSGSVDQYNIPTNGSRLRSGSVDQQGVPAVQHQRSYSIESTQSASETRRPHVLPMGGGGQSTHSMTPNQSSSSLNNSLDESIQSGWSLDRIQRTMEQRANSFDNMLTPLQEKPEDISVHMTSGQLAPPHKLAPVPTAPPSFPKPQVAPKPPKVSKKPASHKPGVNHTPQPEVVPQRTHHKLPKAVSPPPDVIPSSNGLHNSSSDDDPTSIAINKKRPKVPDLTTMDPRKPKLKVKKVPRSVWQPRPMTRPVSSSSESDSDASDNSMETVIVGGPGDSSSLKSAHV